MTRPQTVRNALMVVPQKQPVMDNSAFHLVLVPIGKIRSVTMHISLFLVALQTLPSVALIPVVVSKMRCSLDHQILFAAPTAEAALAHEMANQLNRLHNVHSTTLIPSMAW